MRQVRASETNEERTIRLTAQSLSGRTSRALESTDRRQTRLDEMRMRMRNRIELE